MIVDDETPVRALRLSRELRNDDFPKLIFKVHRLTPIYLVNSCRERRWVFRRRWRAVRFDAIAADVTRRRAAVGNSPAVLWLDDVGEGVTGRLAVDPRRQRGPTS